MSQKKIEFLDSIEGENAVMAVAHADIAEQFAPERFRKEAKHFGGKRTKAGALADQLFAVKEAETERPFLEEK